MPQTPLTAVLANALAVSSFLANFRLTSERPLALFFDTKKHIQVVPEIFTATGNSVCCLQRIGKKALPHFHIFRLHALLQIAKQKTPQTPFTAVLANALAVGSFLGKFPLNIGTSVGFVFLIQKTHSGCA